MPYRPIRSLVPEDRSSRGVGDQTGLGTLDGPCWVRSRWRTTGNRGQERSPDAAGAAGRRAYSPLTSDGGGGRRGVRVSPSWTPWLATDLPETMPWFATPALGVAVWLCQSSCGERGRPDSDMRESRPSRGHGMQGVRGSIPSAPSQQHRSQSGIAGALLAAAGLPIRATHVPLDAGGGLSAKADAASISSSRLAAWRHPAGHDVLGARRRREEVTDPAPSAPGARPGRDGQRRGGVLHLVEPKPDRPSAGVAGSAHTRRLELQRGGSVPRWR
jgi:hypothetical protein